MANTQAKEDAPKVVPLTFSDMIWLHLQETNKRMDRLENRQEKLEEKMETVRRELNARMDKLDARIDKQGEKIDKLAEKIDKLAEKMDSSTKHGNIMTASVVGIALAVIYFVLK